MPERQHRICTAVHADAQWAHTVHRCYRQMKQNIMRCGDRAITHGVSRAHGCDLKIVTNWEYGALRLHESRARAQTKSLNIILALCRICSVLHRPVSFAPAFICENCADCVNGGEKRLWIKTHLVERTACLRIKSTQRLELLNDFLPRINQQPDTRALYYIIDSKQMIFYVVDVVHIQQKAI